MIYNNITNTTSFQLVDAERSLEIMAEKINIEDLMLETYADKSVKAYNDLIAKPDSLFGLGSAAAEAAASAAALALKAVRLSGSDAPEAAHAEKEL